MNKYNSRICCKQHNQRTSMLIKFKEVIQKQWISILIHLENVKKQCDKDYLWKLFQKTHITR